MKPPEDAVETTGTLIWIEDGIIRMRATSGVASTADTVVESVAAIRELTNGVPIPVLDNVREWPGADHAAWGVFVANAVSLYTAIAWLVDTESAPRLGAFPETIARLLVPFELFTDEEEALAFLRPYVTSPTRRVMMTEPPDDAVEVTEAFLWIDDGNIFQRSKPVSGTGQSVSETMAAIEELAGGVPVPLLHDARSWPGGDIKAWTTALRNMTSRFTRVAMLIDPDAPVGTGPFTADRLPIPFKRFTEEADALAFVYGDTDLNPASSRRS